MKPLTRFVTMTVLLAATIGAAGCGAISLGGGGSSRTYDITTNRSTYNRGNVGEATLRNSSDESVEYNLCARRLERQVDRNWITAFEWPTAGSACTAEARTLRRGDAVNTFFDIPTGIPTGTYRVVFTGLRDKDGNVVTGDRAATREFTVR
jgi:hypothetical protein